MKNLLVLLVLVFALLSPLYAQPYYLAGDFQGWNNNSTLMYDDGTNGDLVSGDGIYSREFAVTSGYHGWKVTDGTWNVTWPAANAWFDLAADQTVLFTLDTNIYGDGWMPAQNIVKTNEDKPTSLVAVGDWQSEAGESGDWTNNSAITVMRDDGLDGDVVAGDGIFVYHINTLPAGNWLGKAVDSGTWHGWGIDGRSEDAKNIEFTTTVPNQDVYLYVDVNSARVTVTLDEPVPVELTSFTAAASKNNVTLSWITATETNNNGFEIERAKSNSGTWETLGFVNGKGNSTSINKYSFVDSKPLAGNIQYRLKQIDFDGTFEYSDVVEVNIGNPEKFALMQNYPNPFNPTTSIQYSIPQKSNVRLSVYNVIGQIVQTLFNGIQEAGTHEVEFSAKGISSGIYFYKIEADNFSSIKKMIVNK